MMEINVKMMTEEAYATLQLNSSDLYDMLVKHPSDSSWLKDYLGFEPYETKKYTIEDFELKYDENYENVELENAIILHRHLSLLPRYIICNMRFWAWITFEKAYKQAIISTKLTQSYIKYSWISNTSRRNLMLGVISKYFFIIELSYDGRADDPYYLSYYLIHNRGVYQILTYSNIGMLRNVSIGYVRALYEYSKEHTSKIGKSQASHIFKRVSRLSSVRIIDLMDEQEIYEHINKKIESELDALNINIDFDF